MIENKIKKEDLRIGNLIQDTSGWIMVVNLMTEGLNWHGESNKVRSFYDYANVIGIEITPEILTNFGFRKIQEGSMSHPEIYRKPYVQVLVQRTFDLQSRDSGEWQWIDGNSSVFVFFIHQLQNLFFQLTGFELYYI